MIKALKIQLVVLAIGLFFTGTAHAATITVTSNADTIAVNALVTLREAITSINAAADTNADVTANRVGAYGTSDTINFNITPTGFYLINVLTTSLPTIVKPVIINGQTQGGSVQNSAVTGDNSTHNIMINCSSVNTCTDGLTLGAGSAGSTIRFIIFDSAPGSAIVVNSANNTIAGCWIGLDSSGLGSGSAANGVGISMSATGPAQSISNNVIGGPNPADRNIIAGNTNREIFMGRFDSGGFGSGSNIVVENNYLGLDKNGSAALGGGQGIFMSDLQNTTIGGASGSLGGSCSGVCNLIAGSSGSVGIQVAGTTSTGNLIQGNFFGTDVTGTLARPNGQIAHIDISQSTTLTIGGTAAGTGNLMSGESVQGTGILVDGGVVGPVNIQGNFIGTTTTGNAVLGNGGSGIHVVGSTNVNIGGTTAAARNVIGGNGNGFTPKGPGILMEGNSPFSTATAIIQGNNIGIGADGATNIGNLGDGIDFSGNAMGSTVGASTSGGLGGNIIAFNGAGRTNGAGIGVQNGANTSNKIFSNSIFSNTGISTGLGIDLSATAQTTDGPTGNDGCDGDSGGNNLQNFPVLTSATTNGLLIKIIGTLNSTAGTTFTIEFFSNPAGPAQAKMFLGSTTTTTNGSCAASFTHTFSQPVAAGLNITATATDPPGNTSEISAAVVAQSGTASDSTISGRLTDSNGNPVAGAAISMGGTQTRLTITDVNGNYQFGDVETGGFYILTPSRANFVFTPVDRSFSQLGNHTDAAFIGSFTGDSVNPNNTTGYFVRQHYLDFLGREPDQGGFEYWTGQINQGNGDANCVRDKRVDVSASFFASPEFQQTGSFIYELYAGALGRTPNYTEFMPDRSQVMGGPNLEAARVAFTDAFVQRPEFTAKYAAALTRDQFVDALLQTMTTRSGADVSSLRDTMLSDYDSGGRSLAVRDAVQANAFVQAEYNKAFVLFEYFGYLRRNPDTGGYDFWLDVLNGREAGNYRGMVCAFITSSEYQMRFSSVVTHSNAECGH